VNSVPESEYHHHHHPHHHRHHHHRHPLPLLHSSLAASQNSTGLTDQALLIHCFAEDFSKNCALLGDYAASNGINTVTAVTQ